MTSTSAREVASTSTRRLGNPSRAGFFYIFLVSLPPHQICSVFSIWSYQNKNFRWNNLTGIHFMKNFIEVVLVETNQLFGSTARSLEDETRNGERNTNRNPEWWGDFSQLVKIEEIRFLGISRYKVELRFWLDLNSEVSRGTNSNWDFV